MEDGRELLGDGQIMLGLLFMLEKDHTYMYTYGLDVGTRALRRFGWIIMRDRVSI